MRTPMLLACLVAAVLLAACASTPGAVTPQGQSPTCTPGELRPDASLVPTCGVWWGVAPRVFTPDQGPTGFRRLERETGQRFNLYRAYASGDDLFPSRREVGLTQAADPVTLFFSWKVGEGMTWADVAAGSADTRIDREAQWLQSTLAATPFFLAIHHEPEDEVDATPGSGMTAGDYVRMYRHTVDRLREAGVGNAVFVWSLIGLPRWLTQPWFPQLYPGRRWVDWIGWDPYVVAPVGTAAAWPGPDFATLMNRKDGAATSNFPGVYDFLLRRFPDTPLMLSEWGVLAPADDVDVTLRFLESVPSQLARFPAIRGFVWFDTPFDQVGQYGLSSDVTRSTELTQAFRVMAHSVLGQHSWQGESAPFT